MKTRHLLVLVLLLAGCGDSSVEPDLQTAGCWTVDGDPTLYIHAPNGEQMEEECNALRQAANERNK